MLALLAVHAVVASLVPSAARRLGPRAFWFAALAPACAAAWAAAQAGRVLDGTPTVERHSWIPDLGLAIDLRLDGFSVLMIALVSGIGVLVFVYSASYFSDRPDLGRFGAVLTLFAGSMLGLVLADNLLALYVFWELTSVTSYLLIGIEDREGSARAAALQAILVTGAGGLVMLGGFVLLAQAAGTYTISELLADPPSGATVDVALVLVLVGAFTKSAQVPFHFWLPGAMAAPTPVSAYLHSATMVKAGIYLVARFAPAFAAAPPWRPVVLTIGAATMLVGGLRALRQHDLKLLLAHGTVSQLGFLVILLGMGLDELTQAGAVLLLAHGAFKAALFLVVGAVDHEAHTRDIRRLQGLARRMPLTFAVAAIAAASMAGLPPVLGFVAKEGAYEALLHAEVRWAPALLAAVVAGSVLTFAYTARFLHGGFATKRDNRRDAVDPSRVGRPAPALLAPIVILSAVTVLLGVAPFAADALVGGATGALIGVEETAAHLALWHGLNTALALSVVTVAAGVALFVLRHHVAAVQERWAPGASAEGVYRSAVRALNVVADTVTGTVQNGSVPVYLGVILLTLLAVPGSVLLARTDLPGHVTLSESGVQLAVAIIIAVAAVGVAVAQRRFAAVLFLGAVGYGVAVLFVMNGGPDLALTQFLVETLAVVIFVLVLRRLPARFSHLQWRFGQGVRIVIAVGVGVFVSGFALVAAAARRAPPVSERHVDLAVPEAGGKNVVNTILVDFRAIDTLGEITVLTVAALGIVSLVAVGRRERHGSAS